MERIHLYHWKTDKGTSATVHVSCYDVHGKAHWSLSFPYSVQYLRNRGWQNEIGIYSEKEFLQVLAGTLQDFAMREPSAALESAHIAIHLVSEFWADYAKRMGSSISEMRGQSEGEHFHSLGLKANAALQASPHVQKIAKVFKSAGYRLAHPPLSGGDKAPSIRAGQWKELASDLRSSLKDPGHLTLYLLKAD